MPGYTHLQHAQPISFAQHLLAYYNMFSRDSERFAFNMQHTNVSPLGAAALAGTTFPIDRQMTSDLMGFAKPIVILLMLCLTVIYLGISVKCQYPHDAHVAFV